MQGNTQDNPLLHKTIKNKDVIYSLVLFSSQFDSVLMDYLNIHSVNPQSTMINNMKS